jgi:hypothetical protein
LIKVQEWSNADYLHGGFEWVSQKVKIQYDVYLQLSQVTDTKRNSIFSLPWQKKLLKETHFLLAVAISQN